MRLHDLTRRADLVEKMPSIARLEEETVKGSQRLWVFRGPVDKVDYKLLVVPRIKPAVPESDEESDSRRFIDRHKVIWFTRRLPFGYHATERATEYAKEHGVELLEGETIVREHYRGVDSSQGDAESLRKIKFRKDKQK